MEKTKNDLLNSAPGSVTQATLVFSKIVLYYNCAKKIYGQFLPTYKTYINSRLLNMKKNYTQLLIVLVATTILVGCATPYQPLGLSGGYSDTALNQDTYAVSFKGNGATSQDQIQRNLLRRCAEVTINHGYKYFTIVQGHIEDNSYSYQTAGYASTTFSGGVATTVVEPSTTETVTQYTDKIVIKLLNSNKNTPKTFDANVILNQYKK